MGRFIVILSACILLTGCVPPREMLKGALGISTSELEAARKDAAVKVLDYDYATCYAKVEDILKKTPRVSTYAKTKEMIAVFYINPNTTPVGVFFTEVDPTHTKVEVSSPGQAAKEWISKNIFSETPLQRTPVKKPSSY